MVSKPDNGLSAPQTVESSKSDGLSVLLGSAALGFVEPLIREAEAKAKRIEKRKTKARQKIRGTR